MQFRSEDDCLRMLFDLRFGMRQCPKCGRLGKYSRARKKAAFQCACGGDYVSPKSGTIFHKSDTPLRIWFQAIELLMESPDIGARTIQRTFGVTYKTAWRMKHQIQTADPKFLLKIHAVI